MTPRRHDRATLIVALVGGTLVLVRRPRFDARAIQRDAQRLRPIGDLDEVRTKPIPSRCTA